MSKVIIRGEVFEMLQDNLQKKESDPEKGGFLVGEKLDNGTIIVRHAFLGKAIYEDATTFQPSYLEQLELQEGLKEHNLIIVGYWHTHYEDNARPSDMDLESYRILSEQIGIDGVFIITSKTKNVNSWVFSHKDVDFLFQKESAVNKLLNLMP